MSKVIDVEELQERLRGLDAQIAKLTESLKTAKIKRAAWAELLELATPNHNGTRPVRSTLGPTDAVVAYLHDHPGASAAQIVAGVLDSVERGAADPRKNLYQTVLNLKNRGVIEEYEIGLLRLRR